MRLIKAKRLSDKIFGYTMLLYLAVVCAITFWLVTETYRSAKQGVYRELKLYERTFSKSLSENLWSMDMGKLSSLVQGILQTQEIFGVRIVDPKSGQMLARSGWVADTSDGKLIYYNPKGVAAQAPENKQPIDIIEYNFPLIYDLESTNELLGEVTLFSGRTVIFERIKYRVILIVIGAIVQIVFLWLCFSWISRRFLSRPLIHLAHTIESFDLNKPEATPEAILIDGQDELAMLSHSFSAMQTRLAETVRSLQQNQIELGRLNEELEERVRERTARLEITNSALQESENRFRAIIEGLRKEHFFFIQDTMGVYTYISPSITEVLGYSAEEYTQQFSDKMTDNPINEEAIRLGELALQGKEQPTYEMEVYRKDGGIRLLEVIEVPIFDEHQKVIGVGGVAHDITERKQMDASLKERVEELGGTRRAMLNMMEDIREAREKADEANKAKGDFLANMSHEIRTPMNAVIGMTHLALKTDLTPKQHNYLTKIQSSANSLLGIINDILDFSKIEAGKLDMETADFNLDEVLDNLANLITVKAHEKEELEVLFATAASVPRSLVGDPLRLGQVLINLANNAVKFTDSGEIVVSTELIKQDDDKNEVNLKFSVRDSGIGMTEEQMARLFQSFSQADTSTTRKYGGTGLGLAISKRLVEMMNGEIWVESQAGQGSTFCFTATFGRSRAQEKKQQAPPQDLRGMKTLVVDDNATSRQILQDMLESFSFRVTLAASGKEGLAELEKAESDQPFELVIMDWKMPRMDGIETSRHIKAHTQLSKIPAIILVTAYGREEIMHQAESEGLDGFLIKPLSPSVLFDAIMHAFGKETAQRRPAFGKDNEMTAALKNIQGAHLLLAEDNEINQQVAREILESAGFIITLANNGQEAVDAVKQNQYDAVLMDIQMPVLDGYEATRRIRKWEGGMRKAEGGTKTEDRGQRTEVRGQKKGAKDRKPTTRNQKHAASDQQSEARNQRPVASDQASNLQPPTSNIPIIAMTAHAMAGDQEKSLAAGMNDHVNKPIDPGQLFSTLVKWVQPPTRKTGHPESQAAAEPADPDMFPESLPGFDLSEGLNRLQGNQKLYKKLLLSLADKYSGMGSEIRDRLEVKDWDQSHSLVHTLKGMAGNLAATDLQAAAVDLEKLVKHVDPDAPPAPDDLDFKLKAVENTLNQALTAVETLRTAEEEKTTEPPANQTAALSPELAKDAAKRLRDAAEMGDVTELNEITDEFKSSSDAFAPYAQKIVQFADEFDFENILKMADDLDRLADA